MKNAKNSNVELDNLPQEAIKTGENNERQVLHAIKQHNQAPFPILNRGERKLVQKHMMEELSQGFEHRKQALGMALETRLHSIREACNHVLVTGKTHLRQQRLEYFGDVFRQVEQRMNLLADNYLNEMDDRFERLKHYKTDAIKKREKVRLEKSVSDFLDTLDQLMDEFRSIISENIEHADKQTTHSQIYSSTSNTINHEDIQEPNYNTETEVSSVVEKFMQASYK